MQYPLYSSGLCPFSFSFRNWKFISNVDLRTYSTFEKNTTLQLHTILKGDSEGLWLMKNPREEEYWIPRGLFWSKLKFQSLFISVLVNTASVSTLFEDASLCIYIYIYMGIYTGINIYIYIYRLAGCFIYTYIGW